MRITPKRFNGNIQGLQNLMVTFLTQIQIDVLMLLKYIVSLAIIVVMPNPGHTQSELLRKLLLHTEVSPDISCYATTLDPFLSCRT